MDRNVVHGTDLFFHTWHLFISSLSPTRHGGCCSPSAGEAEHARSLR
jgi:hypothetical protein